MLIAEFGAALGLLHLPVLSFKGEGAVDPTGESGVCADHWLRDLVEVHSDVGFEVGGDLREQVRDECRDVDAVEGELGEITQRVVGFCVAAGEDVGRALLHQGSAQFDCPRIVLHHSCGEDDDLGPLLVLGPDQI